MGTSDVVVSIFDKNENVLDCLDESLLKINIIPWKSFLLKLIIRRIFVQINPIDKQKCKLFI